MPTPLNVFCCYARTDQLYLRELQIALDPLRRTGLITVSSDINISPGENWKDKIHHYLHIAHIILLLVSPDFLASDYCYDFEMKQAVERHKAGDILVIPILLRPCSWQNAPFATIQLLPTNAKPITNWADKDNAYLDVVNGIENAIENLLSSPLAKALSPLSIKTRNDKSNYGAQGDSHGPATIIPDSPGSHKNNRSIAIIALVVILALFFALLAFFVQSWHTQSIQLTEVPTVSNGNLRDHPMTIPTRTATPTFHPTPTLQPTMVPSYAMSYFICGDGVEISGDGWKDVPANGSVTNTNDYSGPVHSYMGPSGDPKNSPRDCSGNYQYALSTDSVQATWEWPNAYLPNGFCNVSVHIPSWYAGAYAQYTLTVTTQNGSSTNYLFDVQNQDQSATTWLDLHINDQIPSIRLPKSTNNTYTLVLNLTNGTAPQGTPLRYLGADAIRFNCFTSASSY